MIPRMVRSSCSQCASGGRARDPAVVETASWILTASVVALIPKCPVCLAAYVACGTGIGLSVPTAGYLRMGLIAAGVISLSFLTWRLVRRLAENRVPEGQVAGSAGFAEGPESYLQIPHSNSFSHPPSVEI